MRHFQMCLIILAIAMVLLFMVQNLTSVTTALLGWSLTLPLSLLTVGAYLDLFGLLTGGAAWSLLRRSIQGVSYDHS